MNSRGTSRVIPVRLKVLADAETPIGLYRKLAHGQPGTFLMESAAVGGAWSRYSFIGSRSRATLTTKDGQAHWLGAAARSVCRWTATPWTPSGIPSRRSAPTASTACRPSPPAWSDSWAGKPSGTGKS